MNNSMRYFLILGILAMAFSSCTLEKRRYTSGYHIEWQNRQHTAEELRNGSAAKEKELTATSAEESAIADLRATETAPSAAQPRQEEVVIQRADAAATESAVLRTNNKVVSTPRNDGFNREISVTKTTTKFGQIENKKEVARKASAASSAAGGKSWLVAVLLCVFLGGLGIHRFYLGYTWQGIVQLLTLGGLGIWALIDFIRIIIRSLEPKDGPYVD
jgi:thiol:disulfide interchange protein